MRTSKVTKKVKKDLSVYVNIETGENLAEEVDTITSITVTEDTGLVRITSKNYSMIEIESLLILKDILSSSHIGCIMLLSTTSKTEDNVLYNNNIPHTNTTLQKYLGFKSSSQYFTLIKELINLNVLYPKKHKVQGKLKTIYMINPYVCRKRSKLNPELFEIFFKIKKSEN